VYSQQLPTPIASIIDHLTRGLGFEKHLDCFKLQEQWEEIVGNTVASYSLPHEIRRDTLFLRVYNSVGMQEISFLKAEIIAQVNRFLGGSTIKELRGRLHSPEFQMPRPSS